MISHKPGVRIALCHWTVGHVIHVADQVYAKHGEPELVVTSGMEGTHSPGSLHYVGLAVDLRLPAVDLRLPSDRAKCLAIRNELAERLGQDFDVLLEADHFHIECQPKQPYR